MKEAEKYFLDIFHSCYFGYNKTNPAVIYWFYDKRILRNKKLSKIVGETLKIHKSDGEIIFENNNRTLIFWVKYETVFLKMMRDFDLSYDELENIIRNIIRNTELKNYHFLIRYDVSNDSWLRDGLTNGKNEVVYL